MIILECIYGKLTSSFPVLFFTLFLPGVQIVQVTFSPFLLVSKLYELSFWIIAHILDMWLVLLFTESLICTIFVYSGFFLVCKLYNSDQQIMPNIPNISNLWPVLILEIFSGWDVKKGQFQFLVTLLAVFFWSVNCTNLLFISSHILNMGNALFEDF